MAALKQLVHHACLESVQQKINLIQQSMQEAQLSANEETKSSAGDKYETGRAMAQLEIEKLSSQLAILQGQLQELNRAGQTQHANHIAFGSLVHTDAGVFYIATNAGNLVVDGKKIFAISPQAPIAQKMIGLSVRETLDMNGRAFTVTAIE